MVCPRSKYRDSIIQFSQYSDGPQLEHGWREAVAQGDVAGAYWALLTHPTLPSSLQERVTGELHMLSHLGGASQRRSVKRIRWLESRVASLLTKLEQRQQDLHRRQNQYNEKLQYLQQRLRAAIRAERQLVDARARLDELENNDLVRRLHAQAKSYAAQLAESRLARERAEAGRDGARQRAEFEHRAHCQTRELLGQTCRERDALEIYVQAQLDDACTEPCQGQTSKQTCDVDLCGRCILYVGGRQNVTAHLTQLVQRCNGRLICHDGGLEDSRAHLANLLPQADAVVCPLDCVSHDAYQRVKQFCKQYAKRLVLLPSASMSAFVERLRELQPTAS